MQSGNTTSKANRRTNQQRIPHLYAGMNFASELYCSLRNMRVSTSEQTPARLRPISVQAKCGQKAPTDKDGIMKARLRIVRHWMSAAIAAALLAMIIPQQAAAQYNDPPERVARLNYMRGSVSFQPAGEMDWVSAVVNRPVTTGDRLWADSGARAEMHFGSATVRMDAQTGMSFLNLDDRTTQIELSDGALNIRVLRLDRDEIFEVDTPNQAFSILRPGQYRIEVNEDGNSTMVTVRSGQGEVTGGGRTYSVGAGLTGDFTGSDTLRSAIYRAPDYDEFDTWSQSRDRHDDAAPSARYVSPDLVGYQDLDDYGTWRPDPSYGNVWIPRVSAGWAPYHDGHWVWISPWGWTWIDDAPWGYAPFHYGRWVNVGNSWGWIPGPVAVRPVYAPALVAFIGGPRFSLSISVGGGGGGNVGWFPLGPREVYVPAYQTSRAYVDRVNVSNTTVNNVTITNVYNNTNNTNIQYSNRNVRGGVTAVPQTVFTNAQPVGKSVIVVNTQEIASAPINRRAEVAPTRNSVLGSSSPAANRVSQPPAAVVNRAVVAKTPPPAAPVPFERQQAKLAAQPGQPLPRNEVEALRPASAPAAAPRVRQAPPGKPATADSNQPESPTGNRRSGTPVPAGAGAPASNTPAGRGGNRGPLPAAAQPAAPAPAPANNPPAIRNDRPNGASRGQQPAIVLPPADSPAGANPPANDTTRGRGGNRGQQPAAAQPAAPAPAPEGAVPPASDTNRGRGGNRGQQPAAAQPAAPAPAPAAQTPPASNAPAARGGNRGQRGNAPAPEQKPNTEVPTPVPSNSPGRGGGNRGQ